LHEFPVAFLQDAHEESSDKDGLEEGFLDSTEHLDYLD